MRSMKKMGVVFIAILAVFTMMPETGESLTCGDVVQYLTPCVGYATGTEPIPSPACCTGVGKLKDAGTTTEIRRQACNCAKQAATGMTNLKDSAIQDLPAKCNTSLSFAISRNINCNTIS